MAGEKTEKASAKKREDERKKGHIYQSADIVSAITMLCMFGAIKVLGPNYLGQMGNGMKTLLSSMNTIIIGQEDMAEKFRYVVLVAAEVVLPIMAVAAASSIIVTVVQTRLLFAPSQLKPDFSRINPIKGFGRLFSMNSFAEFIKSLIKIIVIAVLIYNEISPQIQKILLLFDTSLSDSLSWVGSVVIDIGFKLSLAMLIIGAVDYFYQWWSYERQMKMTKEEVKEEFKQMEGNPETKGRIRNLQRRMSQMRMMQAVPVADVVVRNPTHFAVAIKYDEKKSRAPVVVAKGRDLVALKIVEIAIKNNVSVTENKPLAQALYKTVEIGQEIPEEFYKAVAEVLAYLYRLRRAGRK